MCICLFFIELASTKASSKDIQFNPPKKILTHTSQTQMFTQHIKDSNQKYTRKQNKIYSYAQEDGGLTLQSTIKRLNTKTTLRNGK